MENRYKKLFSSFMLTVFISTTCARSTRGAMKEALLHGNPTALVQTVDQTMAVPLLGTWCSDTTTGFVNVTGRGCAGRNELGSINPDTVAECQDYCASIAECISFEDRSRVGSGDRCQVSTSCTPEISTSYPHLDLHYRLVPTTSMSLEDCITTCANYDTCGWVGYRTTDGQCEFWTEGSCAITYDEPNHNIYQVGDSSASEPEPEPAAELLSKIKIRFVNADFDACCNATTFLSNFLLECSRVYAPLVCVDATPGSVIVEFQGTTDQLNDALVGGFPQDITANGYTAPFSPWEEFTAGVEGDPHFNGFDGSHFDFQGSPGYVFNIISDARFQLNARFVESPTDGKTYMGVIGVQVGFSEILVTPDVVVVNGVNVSKGGTVKLNEGEGIEESGYVSYLQKVRVMTAAFQIDITTSQQYGFLHLNLDAIATSNHLVHPHGILGQTAQYMVDGSEPKPVALSHKKLYGQGFITGTVDDYIVADGLMGTQFTFNRFGIGTNKPRFNAARRFSRARVDYRG